MGILRTVSSGLINLGCYKTCHYVSAWQTFIFHNAVLIKVFPSASRLFHPLVRVRLIQTVANRWQKGADSASARTQTGEEEEDSLSASVVMVGAGS